MKTTGLLFFIACMLGPSFAQDPSKPVFIRERTPEGYILHITRTELLRAGKLSVIYFPSYDTTRHVIASFTMSVFQKGKDPILDIPSNGDDFSPTMISVLTTVRWNDKVYFENIIERMGSNGQTQRKLPPLAINIAKE